MYETFLRSNSELPYSLAITGNTYTTSLSDLNPRQKQFRPPLHPRNTLSESKTLHTSASIPNITDVPVENVLKSEPKSRHTPVKPRPVTLEFIRGNSSTKVKYYQEPGIPKKEEQQSLGYASGNASASSYSFFQGRRISSKSIDQEKNPGSDMTQKLANDGKIRKREYVDPVVLLKQIFTNEKIQSSGNMKVVNIEPAAPEKGEPAGFNNPGRKVNGGRSQRRASQEKMSVKQSMSYKNFKLFEETFTKIELPQEEARGFEAGKEEGTQKAQAFREGNATERVAGLMRGRESARNKREGDENREEKVAGSTRNLPKVKAVKEMSNMLNGNGKVEMRGGKEGDEGCFYLRSKSTGNMMRVTQEMLNSENVSTKPSSKRGSVTELSEKQDHENVKISLTSLLE